MDPDTKQNNVHFLALKNAESQDAAELFRSIQQAFKDKGLADAIFEKLVNFCSDRASVNTGLRNGVISKLREFYGDFVAFFWCHAHKLELSLKDAFKGTVMDDIESLLIFLYKCYKNSSKKWRELQELYQSLKGEFSFENNALHPAKSYGTRGIVIDYKQCK